MKLFRPKKDNRIKNSIFSVWRFISCFLIIGFVVTVSFFLFLDESFTEDFTLNIADISARAWANLFNIIFLCVVLSVIDGVRRRFYTKKPVEIILDATHRITKGDFSVQIKPLHKQKSYDEFDIIIEDFNKMAAELSTIETLKTDFIANVSHELKTPLSVIQNYSTMLQNPGLDEATRLEYAKKLSQASKNLSELITSILRLNKLENQQIFPNYEKYNLSEQICESLLKFEEQWEEKGLEISVELDEGIEVIADRELLDIVWSNLMSNAVKFSSSGGIISIKTDSNEKYVTVSVSDQGCGMAEETQAHIFEKFYQGDKSHSTKGNGLGLALVKRVVDIIKGDIYVESELGKGSTFTVKIPRNSKKI